MRIILINSRGDYPNEFPPIGLLYLASIVRQYGHTVKFYDVGAQGKSEAELLHLAKKFEPNVCGISLYTTQLLSSYRIISHIKRLLPSCKIVVGGPHAAALPEHTMQECPFIDFLVYGEGEITFTELLNSLQEGKNYHTIKGLFYRVDGNVRKNVPQSYIKDLDTLPFPAWDLIKDFRYCYDKVTIGNKVGVLVSSRGCPYKCAFCNKAVFGTTYRRRSPKNVVAEIEYQISTLGINEIYFVDDLFVFDRKWLEEFYLEKKKRRIKIPWKCLGRVDQLELKDYEKMQRNGCFLVQFGVESGNDEVLRDIKKGITISQVKKAFENARATGLSTAGYFIFGHRKDTYDTAWETFKLATELNPDFAHFFILVPFPGTTVYQYVPETLKRDWDRIRYYHKKTLPISICKIKPKDLVHLYNHARMAFYTHPNFLVTNILLSKSPLKLTLRKIEAFLGFNFLRFFTCQY